MLPWGTQTLPEKRPGGPPVSSQSALPRIHSCGDCGFMYILHFCIFLFGIFLIFGILLRLPTPVQAPPYTFACEVEFVVKLLERRRLPAPQL